MLDFGHLSYETFPSFHIVIFCEVYFHSTVVNALVKIAIVEW